MTEQYNQSVAKHYAAYRPPFHHLILSRVIRQDESFQTGLDIGCGTGYSTIALTDYCERVFGLDPNEPMLEKASENPKITYICGTGNDLSFVPTQSIDIVTFAGSLFYAKSDSLRNGLLKTCNREAAIIVYDFEVLIGKVMTEIGIDLPPVSSDYDHSVNFSDWTEFFPEVLETEQLDLELSSAEFAHVMLADSNRFIAFSERFQTGDPYTPLVDYFESKGLKHQLHAVICFSRYRML